MIMIMRKGEWEGMGGNGREWEGREERKGSGRERKRERSSGARVAVV